MIVQSFGSGSSGNALLVRSGDTSILIDCGIGPRVLQRMLKSHGTTLELIDAVLVTHEHDDHVRGLDSIMKRRRPLHATPGTAKALGITSELTVDPDFGAEVEVGGLSIRYLPTSHDAAEPCGFSLYDGTSRITLMTDLGVTDDRWLEVVAKSNLIVIEANHDVHMLRCGPYPAHLKRRVLSETGHLSNEQCGDFLNRALQTTHASRTIWLAHLSATNNRPEIAEKALRDSLVGLKFTHQVSALPRREPGPVWNSTSASSHEEQLELFPGPSSSFGE